MPQNNPPINDSLTRIQEILAIAEDFNFKKGHLIFCEGEEDHYFYIIADGKVVIKKKSSEGVDRVIAELGPGEFFGENVLLQNKKKPASAEVTQDVRLLAVSYEHFRGLVDKDPSAAVSFLLGILKVVNERLAHSNKQLLALNSVSKLLHLYRDDMNNLARAVVETLLNVIESDEGAVFLKNSFSKSYRTCYSSDVSLKEDILAQFDLSNPTLESKNGYHTLVANLGELGTLLIRRKEDKRHYIDDDLRLMILVSEEFTYALKGAFDRAGEKARQMLEQKRFTI